MPIQTGILPAGSTLTVDYSIGETATISYQDGDIGVVDNGQTKTTYRTIGPFANDVAYSISYTGWPKAFTTAAGGSITTISLPLPDPATLALGAMAVLTGTFAADVTSVLLTVDYVKGVKSWTGMVVSANDPVNADGLPNGVTWIKV
jgi:hypothetical protein